MPDCFNGWTEAVQNQLIEKVRSHISFDCFTSLFIHIWILCMSNRKLFIFFVIYSTCHQYTNRRIVPFRTKVANETKKYDEKQNQLTFALRKHLMTMNLLRGKEQTRHNFYFNVYITMDSVKNCFQARILRSLYNFDS